MVAATEGNVDKQMLINKSATSRGTINCDSKSDIQIKTIPEIRNSTNAFILRLLLGFIRSSDVREEWQVTIFEKTHRRQKQMTIIQREWNTIFFHKRQSVKGRLDTRFRATTAMTERLHHLHSH
jgi:hypothetical protein